MSLRHLSPLGIPPQNRPRPSPPPSPTEEPAGEELRTPRSSRRKLLAAGALGLTGLSAVSGAVTYAASHLPVCQGQQQIVGWESGRPCVSLDVALNGATAWRYLPAPFHVGDALTSWNSGHNVVLHENAAGTASRLEPAALKVVSWNLHHGQSPDLTGARPQLDTMIEKLQQEEADIYLLQEVAPQHAQQIAEELGMRAYFAASTPVQGNMILLDPALEVTAESVTTTTGQKPGEGWRTLKDWIVAGDGPGEPRNIQVLDVRLPDGQTAVVWNTHNLTGAYSPAMHQRAADLAVEAIQRHLDPGEIVIGGGDLNAGHRSHPLIAGLAQLPIQGQRDNIDWIYASQNLPMEFSSERVVAPDGGQVSDHVLVRATLDLSEIAPP